MEYQFDYATFCKTFNVKDDKAIDSLRLTHTQDINFKLFPYKASGKAQAPIITELEEVVSDFFRKSLKLETEPVKYESLCNDIIAEMDIADEDIEITLQDQSKIYAQAKAVVKPDDYTHVIDKLTDALETLNLAAKNGDGVLFTYVTNSPNPFNNQRTMSFFTGRTHLDFDELPDDAQNKIEGIILSKGYSDIDVHKMDVRIIPFYGKDLKNRYKEIQACVNEFLSEVNVDLQGINTEIMEIWQRDLFQNATQTDTTISISKEKMIWPLIVLVVGKTAAAEYKKDYDDDEIEEIENKYKLLINQNTMSYEMISRVMTEYKKSKQTTKQFVADHWKEYLDIVSSIVADESIKESLAKIILYRILVQRQYIRGIKRGANLCN